MEKARILVVDDEPRYVRAIQINLEASGYSVITAPDGQQAVNLAAREKPDIILLDIMMPGINGYTACQHIRQFSTVPIIMLTALGDTASKVKGLDIGADDYVSKPFSAKELLARVRAALRRNQFLKQESPAFYELDAGALRVDFTKQRVFTHDKEVKLTPTEYRLLSELIKQGGRVLTPEYLLEQVWGSGHETDTQLLWQAIHRLRQKVEADPQNPQYIQTRPGIGYVFTGEH